MVFHGFPSILLGSPILIDHAGHLLQAGALPNLANDAGNCPLHWAALNGHRDVLQALLQGKADVNVVNEFKRSPFDEAFGRGHTEVCELLAKLASFEEEEEQPTSPVVVGIGNPLLDMEAEVSQAEAIERVLSRAMGL